MIEDGLTPPPAGGRGSEARDSIQGGGPARPFKKRNTDRAKQLRNRASPLERLLWEQLRNRQLGYKFSRQIPLGPYFCDFLCREQKLIIELDGATHAEQTDYDIRRDAYCTNLGFRVLRFTNADVMSNLEGVLQAISAALMPTPGPSRLREGGK